MRPDDSLKVSIAHDPKNIEKAIERALGEIALDDFRDKVVAIKPNETPASEDDKTACTPADALRATIRHIKNLHPKTIVVTGGSGAKKTDEVAAILGYPEVIRSEG